MTRCSHCPNARDIPGQRYCKACRAAYMRGYRAELRRTLAQARFAAAVKRARKRLKVWGNDANVPRETTEAKS